VLVVGLAANTVIAVHLRRASSRQEPQSCSNAVVCATTGTFCDYPMGTCGTDDTDGTCTTVPEQCLQVFNPVCGCDRKTYPNACHAAMNNVSVLYEGECEAQQPCASNKNCDQTQGPQYCEKPMGQCSSPGSCAGVPELCTLEINPVCGCDGLTYDNPCLAASNNQSVNYTGACTTKNDTCFSNNDCKDDQSFCQYPTGSCKPPGHCVVAPFFCPHIFLPVCSCRGKNFSNSCYATAAFENVASSGGCGGDSSPLQTQN